MGLKVLSLFDGVSCGMVALERAGIETDRYVAYEIDKYAIQVSKHNYPQIEHRGDVRTADFKNEEQFDLIIGGSPCQNFSFAGQRKGMVTKEKIEILSLDQYLELKSEGFEFSGQSYLFWEYIRILRQVKPKYFLLENVKMSKKWQDIISKELGVEPILINSGLVSAQNRNRLYWTNIPNVEQPVDKEVMFYNVIEQSDRVWRPILDYMHKNFGNKPRVDIYKFINCEKSNCLTTNKTHLENFYLNLDKTARTNLSADEAEVLQTVPKGYTSCISETQRFKALGNGWTVDVIAHIFKGLTKD